MSASARTRQHRTRPALPTLIPPAPLLDTTLDQLRTLLAVHATGTALGAARYLKREQSSVQKQIDTLNRNFLTLCGEPLVVKQGRGKDVLFTGTGEVLVEMASTTLGDWAETIRGLRSRVDGTLTVGATRYMLSVVADACADIADELERREVDLKVEHVRTRDLLARLRANEVDVICGSVIARVGDHDALRDFDVIELRRSGMSLLTNLPPDPSVGGVPDGPVPASSLPSLPLVVSNSGLICDVLEGWFGPRYRDRLSIAAEIDAVPFGLELLCSRLPVHGAMLVTRGIGEAVVDGRISTGGGLRAIEIADDTDPGLEVVAGAFARKGERAKMPADHPLNLAWQAIARRAHQEYRISE